MSPMTQFGAATVITSDIRLILLDCFETLVELARPAAGQPSSTVPFYAPRKGVVAFLRYFRQRPTVSLVVISDAESARVNLALDQAGLAGYFLAVYHAGNACEELGEGRTRKRLDIPLADFSCPAPEAVFIGDSPLDAEAAHHHHVQFIRVPRSEDRAFSFAMLIGGPSRYDSAEFSATFLDQYLTDKRKRDDAP